MLRWGRAFRPPSRGAPPGGIPGRSSRSPGGVPVPGDAPGRPLRTAAPLRSDFFRDLGQTLSHMGRTLKSQLPPLRGGQGGWTPPGIPLQRPPIPEEADVVVVGGGILGWATAFWLKALEGRQHGMRVLLVERDPTYSQASTVLSAGGIRQQFSLPENIQMSRFSAKFLRNINEHLGVPNDPPIDIQFQPSGYLFLASLDGAEKLEATVQLQRDEGVQVALLSPTQLKERFPWMDTQDVAVGSYGLEDEGWFDPWTLLSAFRRKAKSLGVLSCTGEVRGFVTSPRDGDTARIKYVHEDEPDPSDLSVDDEFFQDRVWPRLARRVPAFESLRRGRSWGGYYDFNTFDQNGVVGPHPKVENLFVVAGFSGHGLQHAPAAGRALGELLVKGGYKSLDLRRLGWGRLETGERLEEAVV
ncbi:FAD-dependent oxidoreductase domain-containing protein 1 isoform X3 [Patagioenas fasciata]|uniref:FAD-dependent oxidoreductase domain-containing protein 1 isoform X3 n=1 Tax=Patagioenas fasciata TaxID=372321 RepID=UPI003A99A9DC